MLTDTPELAMNRDESCLLVWTLDKSETFANPKLHAFTNKKKSLPSYVLC